MTATTYTLKHPIAIKNKDGEVIQKIEVVTFQRLRGEHARKITSTAQLPMMLEMLGCSLGLPPSTMNLMDFEDIMAAVEVGSAFFGVHDLMERLGKQ